MNKAALIKGYLIRNAFYLRILYMGFYSKYILPQQLPFGFKFVNAFAENIPEDKNSFDMIVVTYSLCSISDLNSAFDEFKRVLKSDGKLVFCEHGKAPDKRIEKWQNWLTPFWKRVGGGCHLNRDIPFLIENNGFKIDHLETGYVGSWKPASYNYWGTARIG